MKYEHWNGETFPLPSASFVHNQLVGNLARALGNLVVDRADIVLVLGTRLHVPSTEGYVYPDLLMLRGPPVFIGEGRDTISNPSMIVEVVSDATECFARGEKFAGYRSLPSVFDYLLVMEQRSRVEHYVRGDGGAWELRELGSGEWLEFAGIDVVLGVDEAYSRVLRTAPKA